MPNPTEKNALWLDVTMNHPFALSVVQSEANLFENPKRFFQCMAASVNQFVTRELPKKNTMGDDSIQMVLFAAGHDELLKLQIRAS